MLWQTKLAFKHTLCILFRIVIGVMDAVVQVLKLFNITLLWSLLYSVDQTPILCHCFSSI